MKFRLTYMVAMLVALLTGHPAFAADVASVEARLGELSADNRILVTFVNDPAGSPQLEGLPRKGYRGRSRYGVSDRIRHTAAEVGREYHLKRLDGWPIQALNVYCVVYEVAPGDTMDGIVETLAADNRIESAQTMNTFRTLAVSYDDPYLHLQHNMASIQAEQAHFISRGKGTVVAVIDTGADTQHPDLQGRIEETYDFADEVSDAFDSDQHGTEVAGIIAAVADNGTGIVGVAPEAHLALYRACWYADADHSVAVCSSFSLAKALAYALEEDNQVINLSLTGPSDPLLERLIEIAVSQGRIVVAAVDDHGVDGLGFPANVEGVIPVGSPSGAAKSTGYSRVVADPLMAPGQDILTAVPEDRYDFASGNSMAAAHVSGIAALLLELRPGMTAEEFARLLRGTVTDDGSVVNACNAVYKLVSGESGCPSTDTRQARDEDAGNGIGGDLGF